MESNTAIKTFISFILGIIIATAANNYSTTHKSKTLSKDEAQIRSNIQSFSALADQGAFEYLGRLLADEVVVDYTALWGGKANEVSSSDLMKQWANFLPGFDTTFHDLGDVDIEIQDNSAEAQVNFTASHWLGKTGFWSVSGQYEFNFNRFGDNWVINSIKLNYESESGSRDILKQAPALAEKNLDKREALLVEYE